MYYKEPTTDAPPPSRGSKQLEDIQDDGKKISTDLTVIVIAGSPSEFKIKKKLGSMANKVFATQYLHGVGVGDLVSGGEKFSIGDVMADTDDQLIELEESEDDK